MKPTKFIWAAAIALAVYIPALLSFFHSDDLDLLFYVSRGNPWSVWSTSPSDYFRPLISLDFWVEWHLWGLNPLPYHLGNILLHCVNTLLVVRLTSRLTGSHEVGRWAGLFFLVHPGHIEAIVWICGRTDLFATFFCLISLLAYLRFRESRAVWVLCLSLVSFAAALLCKEFAAALPLLLLPVHFLLTESGKPRLTRAAVLTMASFWVVLGLYFAGRYLLTTALIASNSVYQSFSVPRAVAGLGLTLVESVVPSAGRTEIFLLIAAMVVVGVGIRIARQPGADRRRPLYLLLIAALAALPVAVLSFAPPLWGFESRLAYFPSVFMLMVLVLLLEKIRWTRWINPALFLLFAVQSLFICHLWRLGGLWVERGVHDLLPTAPNQRLVVITVPDTRYPVYVFRRGIESGVSLFGKYPYRETLPMEGVTYYSEKDTVTVKSVRGGVDVEIRYAQKPLKRTPVSHASTGEQTPLLSDNPPRFRINLPQEPGNKGDTVYVYFSEGRFHRFIPKN